MKTLDPKYTDGFQLSGDLEKDITLFFTKHEDQRTLTHTLEVVREAKWMAELFEIHPNKVIQAALLHDISNVIPISVMLETAEALGIPILEEEKKYDRSVHQKLSCWMAEHFFGVTDREILSAIESHTTHKSSASMTDKILFVADKISWKLPGEHPHLQEMRNSAQQRQLDDAILIYLNSIWALRHQLKLVHPWLIEAREELMK